MNIDSISLVLMVKLFNSFVERYDFNLWSSTFHGPLRKIKDDIQYYSYFKYAVSYIRGQLSKVIAIRYPRTFDDALEPMSYNWTIFFENLIDKLCEFALIAEEKEGTATNIFGATVHVLNDFVDYLNEEIQF